MKKFSIFLALAFCVCFSVVLSASAVEEDFEVIEEVSEGVNGDEDVEFDSDTIPDNVLSSPPNDGAIQPDMPIVSPVDNSAVVESINGLSETLLQNQPVAFDNMALLTSLDVFGFELVEQTPDFALLYFSRNGSFVLVSHNSIVNLGAF